MNWFELPHLPFFILQKSSIAHFLLYLWKISHKTKDFPFPLSYMRRKKNQIRYNDNNSPIVSILAFITLEAVVCSIPNFIIIVINIRHRCRSSFLLFYLKKKGLKNHLQSINWLLFVLYVVHSCIVYGKRLCKKSLQISQVSCSSCLPSIFSSFYFKFLRRRSRSSSNYVISLIIIIWWWWW